MFRVAIENHRHPERERVTDKPAADLERGAGKREEKNYCRQPPGRRRRRGGKRQHRTVGIIVLTVIPSRFHRSLIR